MSAKALRDLNTFPGSEKKTEGSSKGCFMKPFTENETENIDKWQKCIPTSVTCNASTAEVEIGNTGLEAAGSEIEYIESENLNDLQDVDTNLNTLLSRLDSKDWVSVCEALNHVRQLSIFHKETMVPMLGNVVSLTVKSLKNPRSAVCKTAIMTSADIFKVYKDGIIDSFEPLLMQLLLKSSQDKRFVCEAAEKALTTMTISISPTLLLPKLQPHLKHRNPRIRAKASMCVCRSVLALGSEGIKAYGIDKLIQVAASQLSDQLPESREAARILTLELQSVYEKSYLPLIQTTESENLKSESWESFCQAKLSPLSAQAILRVTASAREENLILGC
ncbi:hypothetical protein AMTRI_Chr10g6380 [Amborella trichopoda]|uniref:TOG domain-containing protein n=2 Tax=Amborella trichopoda TaxID=13333 RepID=W1PE49_AMBTC|nr:hypothetical protein AMTR_s00006p00267780 [Amborella trichopoda]